MDKKRINLVFILILLIAGAVIARLFCLQILDYELYSALAKDQHEFSRTLTPERGEILMQDFSQAKRTGQPAYFPLATNKEFYQAYLVPVEIRDEDKDGLSGELAGILGIEQDLILEKMNKEGDPYEPLKHKVDEATAEKIKQLKAKGVGLAIEDWRYYPNNQIASQAVGFVGMRRERGKIGQYGIEGYYEDELKGRAGFLSGEKDTSGFGIPFLTKALEPAVDGTDLVLTIDQNIQFKAENELAKAVEAYQAESGTIIIMNPVSGAILAMANWPNFNPNEYGQVASIDYFQNPAIQKLYEPGSVFKPITMAAGLDAGKVEPETLYQDEGRVNVGGSVIGNVDSKSYGWQTMTQVLEKSLNTGAYYVQEQLGRDLFSDYLLKFDLDKLTGIDLAGEVEADLSNLHTPYQIDLATISFGQGVAITPIRLLTAISAIANQGEMMKPYLVEKMIGPDGKETTIQPERVKRVISAEAAEKLTKMLVQVTENGSARLAKINGYNLAAKTGTAQLPDWEKGGYSEETIHSFVGYAPAFNPEFAILIKLEKPKGVRFAAGTCSPIFKNLSEYLFSYLEIPPQ